MQSDFEIWKKNFDDGSFSEDEMASYGWGFGQKKMKEKILEILEKHRNTGKPGGCAFIETEAIDEIEKL